MSETKRPSPRPTFTLQSPHSPEVLRQRVRAYLKGTKKIRGTAFEQLIELSISGNDHHFWSPQVLAKIIEHPDGTTTLEARFSPDPHVWSLYVFTYATLILVAIFSLVWGFVQRTLGQSPTALLIAPLAGARRGAGLRRVVRWSGARIGPDVPLARDARVAGRGRQAPRRALSRRLTPAGRSRTTPRALRDRPRVRSESPRGSRFARRERGPRTAARPPARRGRPSAPRARS
jgi:hypothetical protein